MWLRRAWFCGLLLLAGGLVERSAFRASAAEPPKAERNASEEVAARELAKLSAQLRANPKDFAAIIQRGSLYADLGKLDLALLDFERAVREHPREAEGYFNRAYIYDARGQFDKAIADCSKVIELRPELAMGYFNRAATYAHHDQTDKALLDFEQAIKLAPGEPQFVLARGLVYRDLKQPEKAIADFSTVLRIDPKTARAMYERADLFRRQKDYAKAVSDYEAALRVDPNCEGALDGLAWLRATCPDAHFRDGKQAVALSIKIGELNQWQYLINEATLAAAHAEAGNFPKAIEWQKKAIASYAESFKPAARERLKLYEAGKAYRDE